MVVRPRLFFCTFLFACAVALAAAQPACAVQHLIRPGDEWQGLRIRPGDEIILMPGRHRPAAFETLAGTAQRPITIRSADAAVPCTIQAEREGIRVRHASHLVIKDLIITGASVNGITLTASADTPTDQPALPAENVLVQNVAITRTGPRGQRHAILAHRLQNLRIEACRFEGWGGSAIELVACQNVTISQSQFKGLTDHGQINGIRARAGSQDVQIEDCRFENAGAITLCMGGSSDLAEFAHDQIANASDGTLFEAARVRIDRSLIIGSQCPAAFINAGECMVRNNTIIHPRRVVLALLAEQSDSRFSPGNRNLFGRNLVMWDAGDLQTLAEVGPKVDASNFMLDANLWWSPEDEAARSKLGSLPGKQIQPQVVTVDPKLDQAHVATDPAAIEFGFR